MEKPKEAAAHEHVISLRKLSDDLYWRIKERAVKARQGIEEYVVTVLEEATKAEADEPEKKGRAAKANWQRTA